MVLADVVLCGELVDARLQDKLPKVWDGLGFSVPVVMHVNHT